jgi:site-specific DNA recombinase
MVADVVTRAVELDPTLEEAQATGGDDPTGPDLGRIVRLLVEKVIGSPSDIEVRLRANGIEELAVEFRPALPEEVAARACPV